MNGHTGFGRLYHAEVIRLGEVPDISEIAEIMLFDRMPGNLTYPEIQPALFRHVLGFADPFRYIPWKPF